MGKVAKYDESTKAIEVVDLDRIDEQLDKKYNELKRANGVDDLTIKDILSKPEDERTSDDLMKLFIRDKLNKELKELRNKYDDYKEFVEVPYDGEVPVGYSERFVYSNENDKVYRRVELFVDFYYVRDEIKRIKKELADTDYIIIKSYEAELLGEEQPYDKEYIKEVATNRAEMRNQINQLEAILEKENSGTSKEKES
jgi:hypothetical protein